MNHTNKDNMKITFIGGGNMASAIISGLVARGTATTDVRVVEALAMQRERLASRFPGAGLHAIIEQAAVAGTDIVVMAVKPQQMHDAARQLSPYTGAVPLVLTIAAGVRCEDLTRWLGGYRTIVRAMPNTPALIGMGITGMVATAGVSEQQKAAANGIMQAVGQTVWLDDEAQIDAVTAVSGSGPAYVFYFIEAMQQAAVEMGLSDEQGRELALATFAGAAQLAAQSSDPVPLLREKVTSKGGTTYAALTSMEHSGVKEKIIVAMKAAQARGRELGDEMGAG